MARHFGGMAPVRHHDGTRVIVVLILLFLFLFALVSVGILYSSSKTDAAVKPVTIEEPVEPRTVEVLVALQRVETGTKLEPPMFRVETRPAGSVGDRVLKRFEEVQNMYARTVVEAGEMVRSDSITKVKPANIITADIPEGFRAVTISVNATSSVEGWAQAGAHVDIVWAHRINGKPAVTVIVQNAKVLSAERQVEANVSPGMPVPSTVTLLVSAADAGKIQLAQTAGSLALQLRGDQNSFKSETNASSITIDDLVRGQGEALEPERREDVIRMRGADGNWESFVMRGGKLVPLDE